MIKLIRVDHRLLHGQVAFSWTSHLGADCILLSSDTLLNDELKLTAVKIARPPGVKLVVKNIKDSIEAIKSGKTDKYNLFIVCDTIDGAAQIANECNIEYINLGGTCPAPNKNKISKGIYITEEERSILKELIDKGVKLNIQMIPSEKSIDAKNLIG